MSSRTEAEAVYGAVRRFVFFCVGSRYLDRKRSNHRDREVCAILMAAFCRGLRRHAAKLQPIELIGSSRTLPDLLPQLVVGPLRETVA
jgi:hypothetical protein